MRSPLFPVSRACLILLTVSANTAVAQTARVGRWEFAFAGPRGVQLAFDGVPILRQSTLNVVKPGWTGLLYGQSRTTHRINTRADGEARVVTIDGSNEAFAAHYEVTLRPDHTATIAFTGELKQDAPAELEYCAGYFNSNLITRRRYTADTANGPREGVVPFLPATPDQLANELAPNWTRLSFDSRLGELTLRVRSDDPLVRFFDARRDPQPWAQDAPIFWMGLGSPARPLAPRQRQSLTLDISLIPNRSVPDSEQPRRLGDPEGRSEKEGARPGNGAVVEVETRHPARSPAPSPRRLLPVPDVLDPRGRAPLVVPRPKEAVYREESHRLSSRHQITVFGPPEARLAAEALRRELADRWKLPLTVSLRERPGTATTVLVHASRRRLAPPPAADAAPWQGHSEGYLLEVRRSGARVDAGTPAGAFYGVQTLAQLLRHGRRGVEAAGARIADWPSFPFRGAHLFLSSADPAFGEKLIDRVLSRFKMNRLVLEVENARWKSHPELHTPQGPSVDQLAAVAERSRERFLEIVPLVQSLGHAQWMFVGGNHLDIAEDPDEPYAYCPSNPKSYELLFDIYDEAIRLFRPRTFHIGHDEVRNRGRFPLHEVCQEKGFNRLFAEDVAKLTEFLKSRGVRPMLWGDMLLHATEASDAANAPTPEAARELRSLLPRELLIADWHYAGVPEFPSVALLRSEGFDVVGAGWWNALNVAYLARAAAAAKALGLLQTTWVGRYPTEKVLDAESRQFVAMVLAAEYAWSGREDLPEMWEYSPGEVFARAWAAALPEAALRPGALVDLEPVASLPLAGPADSAGWLGLGPDHDLSGLPGGRARLGDVLFRLPAGRAAALGSRLDLTPGPAGLDLPIDRMAAEVALLNATAWRVPAGTPVARMTVTYDDGRSESFELIAGRSTAAWTDPNAAAEAPIAWRGRTRAGAPISLRLTRWQNPRPGVTIRSLRFEPLNQEAAWTLFALSLIDPAKDA